MKQKDRNLDDTEGLMRHKSLQRHLIPFKPQRRDVAPALLPRLTRCDLPPQASVSADYDDGYGTAYDEQSYDSYDNSYSAPAQSQSKAQSLTQEVLPELEGVVHGTDEAGEGVTAASAVSGCRLRTVGSSREPATRLQAVLKMFFDTSRRSGKSTEQKLLGPHCPPWQPSAHVPVERSKGV
ncbi:hypothetical protein J1605_007508 [Eschrichtius robustus]|uniref:Sam68 tyrosine-rich domain-containing protein n=1 Tax=Eschrichtius robustus TaxID=9764 RepID=A0AB34GWU3_ESCRO|nr:hypothetical protein J1605_007508 [Eschrichtius robustus]